jgi:uncharacterized phiE125 gp8 family phage protein
MKYYEVVQRGNLRYRSLRRIAGPTVEPVSVAEAKAHLRIDSGFTDDDLYLQSLISAARIHVETVSDRTLIRSQWQMKMDVFPSWDIELPRPPFAPGDVTVSYVPSDAVYLPVSFTNFRIDGDATPAVIRPQWNGSWPSSRGAENDVTITYWAGYGPSSTDVPTPARHCVLMLVASWYANREAVVQGGMNPVPMAVEVLLGAINWGQYR